MVVLGVFSSVFQRWRTIYRHAAEFWTDERHGGTLSRFRRASGDRLLPIPASFLRLHGMRQSYGKGSKLLRLAGNDPCGRRL